MTRKALQDRINEVKSDYIRIQGDLEKLDSVGGNTANAEKQLEELEKELDSLNKKMAELKE
ncbi:SE1832 family protein [Aquibacillus albus]|uniref:Peptidoglycan hydrolase CwlO-like protein n=1 Tax=Aquibacillus albus TaxID=1168171 RepID=A0ABS2MXB6_9BACI|nr:SE1832 family protein [Aquibacillus albus]MBM7570529.1 peptidoglycan hydrolase CwlO-like protein [Aquibacillus albus]